MKLDILKHLSARNMKQAALADASGISHGFMSEIISGKKMPSVEKIERFAEVLGVSVADLIVPDEAEQEARALAESEATPWRAPPRSTMHRAIAAMSIGLTRPETYLATVTDPALSVRRGDVLVIDMSAKPEPGSLVIATLADESTGMSFTILRQWLPGWLVGGETPEPVTNGGNSVAILGVVSALLREAKA